MLSWNKVLKVFSPYTSAVEWGEEGIKKNILNPQQSEELCILSTVSTNWQILTTVIMISIIFIPTAEFYNIKWT